MLLSAFLTDIESRCPHQFTDAEVIRWTNEIIEKIYREVGLDGTSDVSTTEDLAIYDFPSGVIPENIKAMTISMDSEDADDIHYQRHLYPIGLNDPLIYNSWAKVDEETFMVYPTPSEDGQIIRIYYSLQPPEYTSADTAEDLEDYLRKDYLSALKYGVMRIISENNDDIAKANNYGLQYNSELVRMRREKAKKNGKFPRTVDVNKRSAKHRRYRKPFYTKYYGG